MSAGSLTSLTAPSRTRRSSLPSRVVAAAAFGGMAAHLTMVADGGWMAAVAVVMAAVCAPCAWGMWRRPTESSARMLTLMSLAMALIHVVLAVGHGGHAGGHAHGAPAVRPLPGQDESVPHGEASLLIAAVDFAVAWLTALWLRTARRGTVRTALPQA